MTRLNYTPKIRTLKIQEKGDFYAKKYYNKNTALEIKLSGQWLYGAGFLPEESVTVENPSQGLLIIRLTKKD